MGSFRTPEVFNGSYYSIWYELSYKLRISRSEVIEAFGVWKDPTTPVTLEFLWHLNKVKLKSNNSEMLNRCFVTSVMHCIYGQIGNSACSRFYAVISQTSDDINMGSSWECFSILDILLKTSSWYDQFSQRYHQKTLCTEFPLFCTVSYAVDNE